MISPVWSARRPGPTARTSPCWGFSLAVSGMTRPLAVFSSDSFGFTTMRSSRGCRFMLVLRKRALARASAASTASTLEWRVLTLRPAAGTFNRRLPTLHDWGARMCQIRHTGAPQWLDEAEVGVGAGVEGGGAVAAEPPEPRRRHHRRVVGAHRPARQ